MRPGQSTYYPPRAGMGSRLKQPMRRLRLLRAARDAMAERFRRCRNLPSIPLWRLALAILVPGLGIWLRGHVRIGRIAMLAALGLVFAFFIFLGSPWSSIAFALLLCLHCSGLCYFLEPYLCYARLGYRIALSLAIILGLAVMLYTPIRSVIEHNALMPVRSGDKTIVVRHVFDLSSLHRGETVAFRVREAGVTGLRIREGVGLGPILGKGGDTVEFSETHYIVNGTRYPRLPYMPRNGSLTVRPNCYFVWPKLSRSGVPLPAGHESLLMQIGEITHEDILGKAFNRWFWRKQLL